MIRFILASLCLLGAPVLAFAYHYSPSSYLYTVKTPMVKHSVNYNVLTYSTPLHSLDANALVEPLDINDLGYVDVHMASGPDQSAYAHLITKSGKITKSKNQDANSFFLKGKLSSIKENEYEISYGLERLTLPIELSRQLSAAHESPLKAVWHVRSNGEVRVAGFEIDGVFRPYQFSRKDVILVLTQ